MTPFVRLWIWISAFASLTGWTLSALGQLNRAGYGVSFLIFAVFVFLRRHDLGFGSVGHGFRFKQMLRRLRRPLPLCFAALAALVFLGGVLYPPTHYTALVYHIPRVLHWLAEGQWHWIHTPVVRMNYPGCAFEWLSAPLLLFTGSLRGIFLLNVIPFLLLPGLIYSLFVRLGVRARAARHWMWLLPTGYAFLLQAGSAGNDAFAVVFALAALDFGCRAWQSRQPRDLWYSTLAIALLVGTKPTSLPLLLPWAVLVFALLPLLRQRVVASVIVSVLALAVSFFPVAVLNQLHCGDWLGASIEPFNFKIPNPLVSVSGNAFVLLLQNLTPPVFPLAGWWNQHCPSILPQVWTKNFIPGFFNLGELPTEDWAGVGFGISVLALVSFVAALLSRRTGQPLLTITLDVPRFWRRCVLAAPWLALLFYCAKAGMATPARLLAPYYLLLVPGLLVGAAQSQIVRRLWWRLLAGGVMLLAFTVLVVSPDRPLWPAKTVLSRLAKQHPDQKLIARALGVYTVYSQRANPLAKVRAQLPPEIKTVGFIGTEDDSDISFWLPLGQRRVKHFLASDPPELFRQAGVEFVVVGGQNLGFRGITLAAWMQKTGAEAIATNTVTLKITEGPQPWYLVRLQP
jgi:hypothetical protein